jgi:hypothetical protein
LINSDRIKPGRASCFEYLQATNNVISEDDDHKFSLLSFSLPRWRDLIRTHTHTHTKVMNSWCFLHSSNVPAKSNSQLHRQEGRLFSFVVVVVVTFHQCFSSKLVGFQVLGILHIKCKHLL